MKKRNITLLFFIFAFGVGAQNVSRTEKQIVDLSNRKFTWLVDKKYDSLEMLLDDRLVYVHSSGWVQSKREVIADSQSGKLIYVKVLVKESSARMYDSAAIVNGVGTFEGVTDGKSFAIDLRYTEVYIKSGNRWKLASRHANRMP